MKGRKEIQIEKEMTQAKDVVVRLDQETVLDKLSFEVKRGAKVAVEGLSGKSTPLNLLLGIIIPESGVVRVTGHPLDQGHIHTIRLRVAYIVLLSFLPGYIFPKRKFIFLAGFKA